jgi:hypothetical protein
LDARGLADAVVGTGAVGDAQRGVVLAPWRTEGWSALKECVSRAWLLHLVMSVVYDFMAPMGREGKEAWEDGHAKCSGDCGEKPRTSNGIQSNECEGKLWNAVYRVDAWYTPGIASK